MTTDKSAKILLLGKTGTGKSSFINYFIGKDVAKTGVGKPVTQGYCIEYDYSNGKYPIKIFDNQGFEAKTAATQKAAIIKKKTIALMYSTGFTPYSTAPQPSRDLRILKLK